MKCPVLCHLGSWEDRISLLFKCIRSCVSLCRLIFFFIMLPASNVDVPVKNVLSCNCLFLYFVLNGIGHMLRWHPVHQHHVLGKEIRYLFMFLAVYIHCLFFFLLTQKCFIDSICWPPFIFGIYSASFS